MKRVSADASKCMGCRVCEIVCSSVHGTGYMPRASRIRVPTSYPMPCPPVVCRQCSNPACVEACPTGALAEGEWVEYRADECTGCGLCVEACPYGAIWPGDRVGVLKCDTCEGRFECVSCCPEGALSEARGDGEA